MSGPLPMEREERMTLAREIADRALEVYGHGLKAVGLYGSMARGQDGPFSDIEMFCVLRRKGVEFSHEWSYGPGKAEVDFYGEDVLLRQAAEVDGRWPLTHGYCSTVLPLYDPESFFPQLQEVAAGLTAEQFRTAAEGVLVGELYEFIGKVRNVPHMGTEAGLPKLALQMAEYGAFLLGLHHRRCFTTGAKVLPEALALPDRPAGFDALCNMAIAGRLSSPAAVVQACEDFWAGAVAWAAAHGYNLTHPKRVPF